MITANSLNRTIWIIVASLFVVFALYAGYKVFFHHHETVQDQACQQMNNTRTDLSINDALCMGATR